MPPEWDAVDVTVGRRLLENVGVPVFGDGCEGERNGKRRLLNCCLLWCHLTHLPLHCPSIDTLS